MLTHRYRFLLWVTLLLPWAAGAEDQSNGTPLSVCDLAKDPARYSGKTVRLKGQIGFDLHASSLFDARCPTASLGGYTWSNYVCFGVAESEIDGEPLKWAGELYMRRMDRGRSPEMEAILIGVFHSIQSYKHTVVRNGRASGSGFCHANAAPFRLAVKRVEFLSFREAASTESAPQERSGTSRVLP